MGNHKRPEFDELPIACTLNATDGATRLARWRELSDARISVRQTRGQLVILYSSLPGVYEELLALVLAERKCCSFAEWNVTRDPKHVMLRIRSNAQGLAAIAGAFDGG